MSNKLFIHGYAANRVFTYTDGYFHNEFTAPGGAALVARVLNGKRLADAAVPDDSFLRDHLELVRYEDKNKRSYHAIVRRSGITPGSERVDTAAPPRAFVGRGL